MPHSGRYTVTGVDLDELRALRIAGHTVMKLADDMIRRLEHQHDGDVIDLRPAAGI